MPSEFQELRVFSGVGPAEGSTITVRGRKETARDDRGQQSFELRVALTIRARTFPA
jgi:hypothetical protein